MPSYNLWPFFMYADTEEQLDGALASFNRKMSSWLDRTNRFRGKKPAHLRFFGAGSICLDHNITLLPDDDIGFSVNAKGYYEFRRQLASLDRRVKGPLFWLRDGDGAYLMFPPRVGEQLLSIDYSFVDNLASCHMEDYERRLIHLSKQNNYAVPCPIPAARLETKNIIIFNKELNIVFH